MGDYVKAKFMTEGIRRKESKVKDTGTISNKITEENLPNLKIELLIKVKEAYRTPNRLDH